MSSWSKFAKVAVVEVMLMYFCLENLQLETNLVLFFSDLFAKTYVCCLNNKQLIIP